MTIKKVIGLILAAAMLMCTMSVSAIAEESPATEISNMPVITETEELPDETNVTKVDFSESQASGESIDIPKGRSQQQFIDPILVHDNELTAADPTDLFFFSTTAPKALAIDISSASSQYAVQLAIVDWAAGQVYLTDAGVLAGNDKPLIVNNVPAGEYALYVYAQDNVVSDPYTLMYNGTNPAGYTNILKLAPDLTVNTMLYGSSSVYSNGVAPPSVSLNYERNDSWPALGGGTEYVTHHINEGSYSRKGYGSFHSTYVSTDNAIYYELSTDTLWTFTTSVVHNGSTLGFTDLRGERTPRRFDATDIAPKSEGGYGPHYLIYDCNTNQFVYFLSEYNLFLVTGGEVVNEATSKFYFF